MKSELEIMTYTEEIDPTPSTGKIERAVAHVLHMFGLITTGQDAIAARKAAEEALKVAEKALKVAEKLDSRNEQQIEAEWQSMSARAATLKSKMEKK